TAFITLDNSFTATRVWARTGDFVRLSVSDTGTGMDQETIKKIFDLFFTTKGEGQGSGLGLPTVYGIVKQHEGYIDVQSELGKGTRFDIYLPLAEAHHRQLARLIAAREQDAATRNLSTSTRIVYWEGHKGIDDDAKAANE